MRQAYNSGKWAKSRLFANKLLTKKGEHALAKSVVIRSYWNEGDLEKMGGLLAIWLEDDLDVLRDKYEKKMKERSEKIITPTPESHKVWNSEDLVSNYVQEGDLLWMKTPKMWVYWEMPADFNLNETNHTLLELAAELVLSPWEKSTKKPFSSKRNYGTKYSLSFSAGTDSTAAMLLMPEDTVLGYHQRDYDSMIDHRNALNLIDHVKKERDVIIVKSNHEQIRSNYGKSNGFSTDYASGVHLILLADYLDLRGVAFGLVIENGWLKKAAEYRNFAESKHWIYWSKRFNEAGLHLVLPVNMVSEAGCMRGNGETGCGKCWKCFLKNGPIGRSIDCSSFEISTFLKKRPLRTAMHAL